MGSAGAAPDLTALEREILGPESAVTLAPLHLVLLRPERGSRPAGTDAWLAARRVALHHHVAVGDAGTPFGGAKRVELVYYGYTACALKAMDTGAVKKR